MYAITNAPRPLYRIAAHAVRDTEVQSTETISAPPTTLKTIEPPTMVRAATHQPLCLLVYGISSTVYTAQQTAPLSTSRSPSREPPCAGPALVARPRTMSPTPK